MLDYFPFGWALPGRKASSDSYRYGFNGMENDPEIKGDGLSYDFGARFYDNRIGRWFSPDPMEMKYPMYSSYIFAANSPLKIVDPDGRDIIIVGTKEFRDKIRGYLKRLATTKEGSRLLTKMIESKHNVILGDFGLTTDNAATSFGSPNQDGNLNFYVQLRPSSIEDGKLIDGVKKDGAATSGHELGHIEDAMDGKGDDRPVIFPKDAELGDNSIPFDEVNNLHREALIRSALGLEVREKYTGVRVLNTRLTGKTFTKGFAMEEGSFTALELEMKPASKQFDYILGVPDANEKYLKNITDRLFQRTSSKLSIYNANYNLTEKDTDDEGKIWSYNNKFNRVFNFDDKKDWKAEIFTFEKPKG